MTSDKSMDNKNVSNDSAKVELDRKGAPPVTNSTEFTPTCRLADVDANLLGNSSRSEISATTFVYSNNSIPHISPDTVHSTSNSIESAKRSELAGVQKSVLFMPVSSMTQAAEKSFKHYVVALRPWSFTASLTPVALGSVLAYKVLGTFNVWIFMATCMTALSVHAAGNLVNTYFDYVKGVDSKKSDDRTLVDNILTPNDVATMGAVFYFTGCLSFAFCAYLSSARMEQLALIYFGGLSGSFLYTGGMGLKYIALGDLAIFLTFGPVTVLFAFMSQGGSLSWMPILYTLPLALNIEAILHANNTRDMDIDKAAGIITVAIIIGKTGSYILFAFLLFAPYIVLLVFTIHFSVWFFLPLVTIFIAFGNERTFRSDDLKNLPYMMAKLNLKFGLLYILACALTDSVKLPGLQL